MPSLSHAIGKLEVRGREAAPVPVPAFWAGVETFEMGLEPSSGEPLRFCQQLWSSGHWTSAAKPSRHGLWQTAACTSLSRWSPFVVTMAGKL